MDFKHTSVMPGESIEGLRIKKNGIYIDCTLGGAGHSLEIAKRLTTGRLIGVDRDADAIEAAGKKLAQHSKNVTLVKSDFREMEYIAGEAGIKNADGVLFDLGVSSYQLDSAQRGFSYSADAPLDMRMDRSQGINAAEVVNTYAADELERVISRYGEEKFARRIAENTVKAREKKKIETTSQLVEIIRASIPAAAARKEKQHPAKRTFQALRIEVNDELGAIEKAVQGAVDILGHRGRLVIISFHSLEDRIVKNAIRDAAKGCKCPPELPVCVCGEKPRITVITKKPLTPSQTECEQNPRARSAKMRICEKI